MSEEETRAKIEKYAENKNIKIIGNPYDVAEANCTKRYIKIHCQINNETNVKVLHEIGHIHLFKVQKFTILVSELLAWSVGYIICKKNKFYVRGYWKIAKECLKTYWNAALNKN